MNQLRTAGLALLAAVLAACSTPPPVPASPPADEDPAVTESQPSPDAAVTLDQAASPRDLTLNELTAGLRRFVHEAEENRLARLTALYQKWGIQPTKLSTPLIEADLDQDGTPEVITALNGSDPYNRGAIFVIYRSGDGYAVDRTGEAAPLLLDVHLHAVTDVTRDGAPEIIWSASEIPPVYVFASSWSPGGFNNLPGKMQMLNLTEVVIRDETILLKGGTGGAVGRGRPGGVQPRTDTYAWQDGALRLVSQELQPSDYGIDRLTDGLLAERFQRFDQAARAYEEAMAADRPVLPPTAGEEHELFPEAVRALARFRLGALLLDHGPSEEARAVLEAGEGPFAGLFAAMLHASSKAEGCQAAAEWASASPEFLSAGQSPSGRVWSELRPERLCATIAFWPASADGP